MFEQNARRILSSLKESDLVLDIGGWGQPFNRANYVIDIMPYETRGIFGYRGGDEPYFKKETWIQRDICSREPFPFRDKQFDFVICSHTLEDIRDPIWVCQEMNRIGKRGYIETPSRLTESSYGVESPKESGYWHHRWLIEAENNELVFMAKFPLIDHHWSYHFPAHFYRQLPEEKKFMCFFWNYEFSFREQVFPFQPEGVVNDYASFVRRHRGWPSYRYDLLRLRRSYRDSEFRKKMKPILNVLERPVKMFLKGTV